MKKLLDSVVSALGSGRPVVLAGVIASSGSTPRGAGALMAVFGDGTSAGTIGGGAVEYEAQKQAAAMFGSKQPRLSQYVLEKNEVADLGMICGGDVTVFYEYVDPSDRRNIELYSYMRSALDKDEDSWVIKRFRNGDSSGTGDSLGTGTSSGTGASFGTGALRGTGYSPETTVFDGSGLHFSVLTAESEVKPLLRNAPQLTSGDIWYYSEPLKRAGTAYVFGGGHVAQELVPVLSRAGFPVVVYEDRENFARQDLFPDAAGIVLGGFDDISAAVSPGVSDYIVIMTRGHQYDYDVLAQALKTPAPYIGCIGSAKKTAAIMSRLLESGVPEAALRRLYSPIGLKIKAETPAEIAISIAAEMILFRANNS